MKRSGEHAQRAAAPSRCPRPLPSQVDMQAAAPLLSGLTRAEKFAAATALLLSLIARMPSLLPGYSIDDYGHLLAPKGFDFRFALSQGRPLVAPLLHGLADLGLHPAETMNLSTLSLIAALLFAGLVTCRLMRISDNPLACTALLAGLSLHPYQAEIFTFRTASLLLAIPLSLGFGVLLLPSGRLWQKAATVLALSVALSIYQPVVNYLMLALLLAALLRGLSGEWREAWVAVRRPLLLLAASLAVYSASVAALCAAAGVHLNQRAGLLAASQWPDRAVQIAVLLKSVFLDSEPVMPSPHKILLLACFLMAAWAVAGCGFSPPGRPAIRRLAWFAAGVSLAALVAPGAILVLREWWPAPRVLSPYGLFWGGILALGLQCARPPLRKVLAAAAGLALLSMTGLSNRIAADQLRINQRDRTLATLILAHIDRMPAAGTLQGVWLHGGSPCNLTGIRTSAYDLNTSALSTSWAKTWLLNEVAGRRYSMPGEPVIAEAAARCANAPRWPARGAILRIGDYAVVCLPDP